MRIVLETMLNDIKSNVLTMHRLTRDAVRMAVRAFMGEKDLEEKVSEIEKRCDILNTHVDELCLHTTALQQPVARDLRFIASMMRISTNYERISDLAEKVARMGIKERENLEGVLEKVLEMADTIDDMYEILEKAYGGDLENLEESLRLKDDRIDALRDQMFQEIKKLLVETKDLERIDDFVNALLAAKHLERIGDILAKSGARLIFIEKGKRVWIK